MYAPERHQDILTAARAAGRVDVNELARTLSVTPETIRRDLTALERLGLLRRVHGGAIPVERLGFEPAVAERESRYAAEKERIATEALDQLPEGGSIILDAGTTTIRLAELIPADRELTVVTHSLPISMLLAARPSISLHVLGGTVRPRTLAAVGDWTVRALEDISVDVAFIGTNGLTVAQGLTTPDLTEAAVKRALIRSSRRCVVLADHTKVGRSDFVRVAPIESVDVLVTDTGLEQDLSDELTAAGVDVVRA